MTKKQKAKFAQWMATRSSCGSPLPRDAAEGLSLLRAKFDPKLKRPGPVQGKKRKNHVRKLLGMPRRAGGRQASTWRPFYKSATMGPSEQPS